ncbi:hypothetical protein LTS18_010163, partial [Coniosporium uncinatum]
MSKPRIAVIGSLNVDLVSRTDRIPAAGETLAGKTFDIGFGGKGANQAVAAARLSRSKSQLRDGSAEVLMLGAIGDDDFSNGFIDSLNADGVDTSGVRVLEGQKTGTAVIIVEEEKGENRILINAGANGTMSERDEVLVDEMDVVVFQLEIPQEAVVHNVGLAKAAGSQVILNPAPAVPLADSLLSHIDHLIMNESEAAMLSGRSDELSAADDLDPVAADFISKGVDVVIITLGGDGCYYQL